MQAATTSLPPGSVMRVIAEPMIDWVGEDALRVLIVLEDGSVDRTTGAEVVETLHAIQQRLQAVGEDRFAYVEYATESDLAEDADTGS